MRHTVHIMLGIAAEQVLCDIEKYIIKYGSDLETRYFKAMLYTEEAKTSTLYETKVTTVDDATFVSGIENMYNVALRPFYEIPNENRNAYLQNCFSTLYNQRITINNPGDAIQLHVCLYIPLYEAKYWNITQELLAAIESIPQEYNVDLFLQPYDLAFLIEKDVNNIPLKEGTYQKQTRLTVDSILQARNRYRSLGHLIMMQNCNSNGISLGLRKDSFVRIIGEYALLSISHYAEIFNPAAQDEERPIHALGLSVLSFDKYYFVQYLLHQAYIHILDRERITQKGVDVNKVSLIVQQLLSKNVNVFSSFYDEYVRTRLDKHLDQDTIIAEIRPDLTQQIERLTNEFQSYIDDERLSLPEKKATLAQLIGEDDDLLIGYMYNKKQLVIDDCSREVLDFFASENNELLKLYEPILKEDTEVEKNRKHKVNSIAENAALSATSGEPQEMPSTILGKLKDIKIRMRESSNYIRQKSQELADIKQQVEENIKAHKRLTDKGFIFDGHTYQLQHNIEEIPCEEDYIPQEIHESKVDLRQYFTAIKDQGQLGACSSFSIVSIYEYILKKNNALDTDLSEAFVYYNAHRRERDATDEGTSLYNNLLALKEEGVCLEKLYPYSEQLPYVEPSAEAKADALTRLVRKALNVQKDVTHIKSALEHGYPVAVSIRIYESFEPQCGFIQRPSQEEVNADKYGNHAVVLCGYSDEEKIFIARNSWGTKFGDKGYCYIPYSYIEDFMNVACIITEINMGNIRVEGNDSKKTISFDLSNSRIKSAILQNLIDEQKRLLKVLEKELYKLDEAYNKVFQALGNNSIRTTICDGAIARLEYEKTGLQAKKEKLGPKRIESLQLFDRTTKWGYHWFACALLLLIVIYVILLWPCHLEPKAVLLNWVSYIVYSIAFFGSILLGLWHWRRHRERIDLDEDYQSQIERCERECQIRDQKLEIIKLKSHIAGMIIDSLATLFRNLHSKYHGMQSYVGNLQTWREEESHESQKMSGPEQEPFLSLVSNKCLSGYFDECKADITQNIKLFELFRNSYQLKEEEIILFKNKLKKNLVNELFSKLDTFSIYKYVTSKKNYPYADGSYTDIDTLLQEMDKKSEHFVKTLPFVNINSAQNASCKLLFINTDGAFDRHQWNTICGRNFRTAPSCFHGESQYKMTLLQMNGLSINEIAILQV